MDSCILCEMTSILSAQTGQAAGPSRGLLRWHWTGSREIPPTATPTTAWRAPWTCCMCGCSRAHAFTTLLAGLAGELPKSHEKSRNYHWKESGGNQHDVNLPGLGPPVGQLIHRDLNRDCKSPCGQENHPSTITPSFRQTHDCSARLSTSRLTGESSRRTDLGACVTCPCHPYMEVEGNLLRPSERTQQLLTLTSDSARTGFEVPDQPPQIHGHR